MSKFTLKKTCPERQLVFGWASVAADRTGRLLTDWQDDQVTPEELELAAYDHVLHFRSAGERHDPGRRSKGRLIESVVFTREKLRAMGLPEGSVPLGWWVGYKIDDAETWKRIRAGEYRMFSVEGEAVRERLPPVQPGGPQLFEQLYRPSSLSKYNPYHDERGRFTSSGRQGAGGKGRTPEEARRARNLRNANNPSPKDYRSASMSVQGRRALARLERAARPTGPQRLEALSPEGQAQLSQESRSGALALRAAQARAAFRDSVVSRNRTYPEDGQGTRAGWGGGFSEGDVAAMARYGARQSRLVAGEGVYTLTRLRGAKRKAFYQAFVAAAERLDERAAAALDRLNLRYRSGDFGSYQDYYTACRRAATEPLGQWLTRHAAQYGFRYGFFPRPGALAKAASEARHGAGRPALSADDFLALRWQGVLIELDGAGEPVYPRLRALKRAKPEVWKQICAPRD